jgi:hypothetical protein
VENEDEDEANDSEEENGSCSVESSVRTGRRLAYWEGVEVALLLRLRTGGERFNGDNKL